MNSQKKIGTGKKYKLGIIVSGFNKEITDNLLKGALEAFRTKGVKDKNIETHNVPGAYEIPYLLEKICLNNRKFKYDGLLTIGCVIKGETAHFEYISDAVSSNISRISSKYGIPTGFCVLTCYSDEQAVARSRINPLNADTNKGYESALALLDLIGLDKQIF